MPYEPYASSNVICGPCESFARTSVRGTWTASAAVAVRSDTRKSAGSNAGLLVEPENAALLAKALCEVRDDQALRLRMSLGGKQYARRHWDRLRALTVMEGKLVDLLDERRRAPEAANVNI